MDQGERGRCRQDAGATFRGGRGRPRSQGIGGRGKDGGDVGFGFGVGVGIEGREGVVVDGGDGLVVALGGQDGVDREHGLLDRGQAIEDARGEVEFSQIDVRGQGIAGLVTQPVEKELLGAGEGFGFALEGGKAGDIEVGATIGRRHVRAGEIIEIGVILGFGVGVGFGFGFGFGFGRWGRVGMRRAHAVGDGGGGSGGMRIWGRLGHGRCRLSVADYGLRIADYAVMAEIE